MSMVIVPDGGWGWFVVFGVALTNVFNQSLISLFGLIFGEEIEKMGYGTTGAALVMNSMSVITNFSGFITGPVIRKYSYRKTAITGSILTSLGLILSSQATEIWHLLLSYSLLSGLGLGLIAPSAFVAVNSYFSTKKSKAVGIAMAGTGLGQMVMPHVVRYLLDEYSYRGTTLIFGAMALQGIVGASLFQPVAWHSKTTPDETTKLTPSKKLNFSSLKIPVEEEGHIETFWGKLCKILDLHLLKDWVFLNITIGISLVYTVSIFFSMLYPFFLQEGAAKLTRGQTATCMSVLAGADIISRLTMPSISSAFGIGARSTMFFGILGLGIARGVMALQSDYTMLIIISAVTGYIRATTVVNLNLTISEYVTSSQLPGALGLNMVNKGIFVISLGQFLGYVRDLTNSFELGIHISNIVLFVVFLTWLPEMIWKRYKRKEYKNLLNA